MSERRLVIVVVVVVVVRILFMSCNICFCHMHTYKLSSFPATSIMLRVSASVSVRIYRLQKL